MNMEFSDEYFMKKALLEAEQAFEKGEVPVGAVIVVDNKIISRAHNLTELLNDVKKDGYEIKDINTEQSSLEEIFIKLIKENNNELVRN